MRPIAGAAAGTDRRRRSRRFDAFRIFAGENSRIGDRMVQGEPKAGVRGAEKHSGPTAAAIRRHAAAVGGEFARSVIFLRRKIFFFFAKLFCKNKSKTNFRSSF